jgi:hypothetical protein
VQSQDITFTLQNSKGQVVTRWDAGEVYRLTTAFDDESTQALVVASAGTLDVTDPEAEAHKVGYQPPVCQNAWGSKLKNESHTMRWQPPEEIPEAGLCVDFATAQAFTGFSAYQVNTVRVCCFCHASAHWR